MTGVYGNVMLIPYGETAWTWQSLNDQREIQIMPDAGGHQNTDTDIQAPALVPPNSGMESENLKTRKTCQ